MPAKSCFLLLCAVVVVLGGFGYDDELYCPPDACVLQQLYPRGWSGPRARYHICCNAQHPQGVPQARHPSSWGFKKVSL